jgi:hypothetical protein
MTSNERIADAVGADPHRPEWPKSRLPPNFIDWLNLADAGNQKMRFQYETGTIIPLPILNTAPVLGLFIRLRNTIASGPADYCRFLAPNRRQRAWQDGFALIEELAQWRRRSR